MSFLTPERRAEIEHENKMEGSNRFGNPVFDLLQHLHAVQKEFWAIAHMFPDPDCDVCFGKGFRREHANDCYNCDCEIRDGYPGDCAGGEIISCDCVSQRFSPFISRIYAETEAKKRFNS